VLGTFPVGNGPEEIAFDGNNIWVPMESDNTVWRLRAEDGGFRGQLRVGHSPTAILYDGQTIWVSNFDSNAVCKISQHP